MHLAGFALLGVNSPIWGGPVLDFREKVWGDDSGALPPCFLRDVNHSGLGRHLPKPVHRFP